MPDRLTFLAIENAVGVVGAKTKGVLEVDATKNRLAKQMERINMIEKGDELSKHAVLHATNKYDNREQAIRPLRHGDPPTPVARDIVDDTFNNRHYVDKNLNLFKAKGKYRKVRVALCSSVNSMLKYLTNYAASLDDTKFDTLIVYGHGMPGSINMGLGYDTMPPRFPSDPEEREKNQRIREIFGLDKVSDKTNQTKVREMNQTNLADCTGLFSTIQPHVCMREDTGYFHLFLMGCDVGKNAKGTDNTLQEEAADALKGILKMKVCVAAPRKKVDNHHLNDLLSNLKEKRRSLIVPHKHVFVSGGLGHTEDQIMLLSALA